MVVTDQLVLGYYSATRVGTNRIRPPPRIRRSCSSTTPPANNKNIGRRRLRALFLLGITIWTIFVDPLGRISPAILLQVGASTTTTASAASSGLASRWRLSSRRQSSSRAAAATDVKNTTRVLKILETETYGVDSNTSNNATKWRHASWTRADTGQVCASPSHFELAESEQWVGDWKIAVSSRSTHGWVYSSSGKEKTETASPFVPYTTRQRTWLRTIQTTTSTTTSTAKSKKEQKRKRKRRPHKFFQAILDDFNFKGFGLTLYKSALSKHSFGAAFRLPLTLNFATWERHPALPSLSMSTAVFSSGTAVLSVSCSLRMEVIQWLLHQIYVLVPAIFLSALLLLLRGLALAVSALLFPVTRQPLLLARANTNSGKGWLVSPLQQNDNYHNGPQYRRTVEERLGVSCSWRYNLQTGYEFRLSTWHYYAPALHSLFERLSSLLLQKQPPSWMARRSAAVGWSLSGPVPDDGLIVTASGLVSLSGLYLNNKGSVARRRNASSNTKREASRNTATALQQQQQSAVLMAQTANSRDSDSKNQSEDEGSRPLSQPNAPRMSPRAASAKTANTGASAAKTGKVPSS